MAATMATMNIAAASVVAAPAVKTSPSTFRGQRLVANRTVGVAARRSLVVRAADDKGVGKSIQDVGEDFSAAVQRGAESVRDNLQGTQADATSKAQSAGSQVQSKAKQGASEADSGLGGKVEELKDNLFGAGKDAQGEAEKNANKAQSAGKDAQNKAGNAISDAVDGVKDAFNK